MDFIYSRLNNNLVDINKIKSITLFKCEEDNVPIEGIKKGYFYLEVEIVDSDRKVYCDLSDFIDNRLPIPNQTDIAKVLTVDENSQYILSDIEIPTDFYTKEEADTKFQDKLESGINIKTINDNSIVGEGNINIESGLSEVKASNVNSESAVSGQVLQADGSGGASWQTPQSSIDVITISTTSGTFSNDEYNKINNNTAIIADDYRVYRKVRSDTTYIYCACTYYDAGLTQTFYIRISKNSPHTYSRYNGYAQEHPTAININSQSATNGQVLTADGNGGASWQAPSTPSIEGTSILSTGASAGQVLTANGTNGASWITIPAGTEILDIGSINGAIPTGTTINLTLTDTAPLYKPTTIVKFTRSNNVYYAQRIVNSSSDDSDIDYPTSGSARFYYKVIGYENYNSTASTLSLLSFNIQVNSSTTGVLTISLLNYSGVQANPYPTPSSIEALSILKVGSTSYMNDSFFVYSWTPESNNQKGYKFIVKTESTEPATKYDGYIYFITED